MQRPLTTGPLTSVERPGPRVPARVPVPTREPHIALVSASSQTKDQPGQLRADLSVQPQTWVPGTSFQPPCPPPHLSLSLGACPPSPHFTICWVTFTSWEVARGVVAEEENWSRKMGRGAWAPEDGRVGRRREAHSSVCSCLPPKCGSFVYSAGTGLLRNGTFKVILCSSPLQWFPS